MDTGCPLSETILPIPKKTHLSPPTRWELEVLYDPSCSSCLMTHSNSVVHSLSESLMDAGSSLFFTGSAFSEATETKQAFLHTTLSYAGIRSEQKSDLSTMTGDKIIAVLCMKDWKSMHLEMRISMLSWFLMFTALNTWKHPQFIMRYERFPLVLKLLGELHDSIQSQSLNNCPMLEPNGTLSPNGHKTASMFPSLAFSYHKQNVFCPSIVTNADTIVGTSRFFFWDNPKPTMLLASRKRGVVKGCMIGKEKFSQLPSEDGKDFDTYKCTFKFKVPRDNSIART